MIAAVLAVALGVAAVPGTAQATEQAPSASAEIPLPKDDPFYLPPDGYESSPNGTVLRSRQVAAVYLAFQLPVKAHQVLYKSIDSHDKPVAEAATVLIPDVPWTGAGERPLISYQLAVDSLSTRCQPSYTLQVGLKAPTPASTYEVSLSLPALLKGYAVVYSDYLGPNSDFIAGPQSAHAILDGIRAVQHHAPTGLTPRGKVALSGYSGGGIATTWAAEQQKSYAPELNVVGAAAGGVPADLKEMFNHNNGNLGSGLLILGIIGLARAFPEAGVQAILNDKGRKLFADNNDACTLDVALFHPFERIESYTTVPNVTESPQAKFLFDTNNAGQRTPGMPFYNYQGLADEFVPVGPADRLLEKYCGAGGTVQKSRMPFAGHIVGEAVGADGALKFLTDRFDGKPARNECGATA
ncbi:lipase family protein [Amycolatopsis nigrescens]|uniref:lipase family protein n=1 Tax=Amycolatopsis nigrescens TaxID=381445 RepID=UPI00036E48FB|nr:lipase family protein [Amycolatopsis nigrescens]